MKIIITGATGWLGGHILSMLLAENHHVLVVKRSSTDLQSLFGRFGELEAWDNDENSLEQLFIKHLDVDCIIHAATDYGRNSEILTRTFWVNEVFPMRLLENAIRHKVGAFLNMDTFFSDGQSRYEYLSSYSLSKRHFREWGKQYADAGKINFINLMLFHIYGPGDGDQKFIPSMAKRCLSDEEIDLTDGQQKRDFIHVDDVVSAISLILSKSVSGERYYEHYDVGSGSLVSIRELMEDIKKLSNSRSVLNFGVLSSRKGELQDAKADIADLCALGWCPKINLEVGLNTVINSLLH